MSFLPDTRTRSASDLPHGAPYSRLNVGINPFLYASSTPNHTTPATRPATISIPPSSPQPLSPLPSPPANHVLRFTNCRLCRSGRLVSDDLWVTRGRVVDPAKRFWEAQELHEFAADVTIDCHGGILSAGFIDIQINGAFGFDFTAPSQVGEEDGRVRSSSEVSFQPEVIAAGLREVAVGLLRHGVTSFLPTVITSSPDTYDRLLPHYKARRGSPSAGANVLGVHCEGPFITRQGAHTQSLMRSEKVSENCLEAMYGKANMRHVRVVTVAPEIEGMMAALEYVHRQYPHIVLSAGHSSATFDIASTATQHGVTLLTHLFNAMVPFTHRDPGIVGLIGTNDKRLLQSLHYSLITDDIHTHSASVRIAYQCHPTGCVVITDAMAAMGLPPSSDYHIGQQAVDVRVEKGKKRAVLRGSEVLAGSVATMDECVRDMWKASGCSVVEALESGSLHAAEVLGERRKGRLDVDCDADVLLVDDELNVLGVWIGGEMVWVKDGAVTIEETAV